MQKGAVVKNAAPRKPLSSKRRFTERAMTEYVIRLSRENAAPMVLISLLDSDVQAARRAQHIMTLCGFSHAEVWKERRLVLDL
jgi:hypothetical protein